MIRAVLQAGSGALRTARIRTRVCVSALDRPRGHTLDDVLLTEEVEGDDRDDGEDEHGHLAPMSRLPLEPTRDWMTIGTVL